MLPDLPSAYEQGLKDIDASTWFGFFLPAHTPASIIERLHDATVAAMDTSWVQERLNEVGTASVSAERRSPEYLRDFVKTEIERNAAPIKAAGISVN
jgi:tripartite-type tricarboxylate transporter receptor subunit TctC